MMSFNVSFSRFNLTWSEEVLKTKLQSIANLQGKTSGWVTSELDVRKSNWMTRLIWKIFAKHIHFMRKFLYGVDLEKSKLFLQQVSKQLPQNSLLLPLFQKAVLKFNQIAPKHSLTINPVNASLKNENPVEYVHLIGDSTLDNCFWFIPNENSQQQVQQAKTLSVTGQIKKLFNHQNVIIKNHAYDGFTTNSLLKGDMIGSVLPGGKAKNAYMKIRDKENRKFVKPLDNLKRSVESQPDAEHRVILSVGGNDFRVLLSKPDELMKEIPLVQKRYLEVLDTIKKIQGKVQVILCLQYKTVADKNLDRYQIYPVMAHLGKTLFQTPGTTSSLKDEEIANIAFGYFLEKLYDPIIARAKKDGLPILNLTNTFDPEDNDLYISGIEPSEKGGELIAEGIHHIFTHHPIEKRSCIVYTKPPHLEAYKGDVVS